ncbi:primosomal protein N' (replication factor Y) - superfamily II helicase [Methyloprofundus sp.]|uniref:primosomal protein N' (replication factor Y) - superfamily II helicase n=1 Tax=Methyloprofundus sp. TaxID=2020875 RepID=UPI003D14BB3A
MLKYQPGTTHQTCEYCGQENAIVDKQEAIQEYDFHNALETLAKTQSTPVSKQAHCDACGANFKFAANLNAGQCPFCGTDIVVSTQQNKLISPKSLLPFVINQSEANDKFHLWLQRLWFAPNKIKKYARKNNKLIGIYIPYWTYDSDTETTYTGARGDTYYVNQRVSYVQNGRQVSTVKRVPKIRWTHVRGRVSRFFDDVLIGASRSLPRQIIDHLHPWDLQNLVPYEEKYISGFQSEVYQVELDEGFDHARQVMDGIIHQDIAYDIGGDHQRIHKMNTRYNHITYKHCLLPIWSAAFLYRNKTYRFVVNGRTGQVQGERPYSYWKIAIAVITGLIVIGGGITYLQQSGALEHIEYGNYYAY